MDKLEPLTAEVTEGRGQGGGAGDSSWIEETEEKAQRGSMTHMFLRH